jgi:aldose sugar dehydrogenase
VRDLTALGVALLLVPAIAGQQPANIGFKPPTLSESSYTFETAEQPKIRVTPVVRGLPHPFSMAFLPNGDALVAIRASQLRIVRNATGAGGKAAFLDPEPVAGITQITPPLRNGGLHEVALHPKFAENGTDGSERGSEEAAAAADGDYGCARTL